MSMIQEQCQYISKYARLQSANENIIESLHWVSTNNTAILAPENPNYIWIWSSGTWRLARSKSGGSCLALRCMSFWHQSSSKLGEIWKCLEVLQCNSHGWELFCSIFILPGTREQCELHRWPRIFCQVGWLCKIFEKLKGWPCMWFSSYMIQTSFSINHSVTGRLLNVTLTRQQVIQENCRIPSETGIGVSIAPHVRRYGEPARRSG